jgi:hypothetical protein
MRPMLPATTWVSGRWSRSVCMCSMPLSSGTTVCGDAATRSRASSSDGAFTVTRRSSTGSRNTETTSARAVRTLWPCLRDSPSDVIRSAVSGRAMQITRMPASESGTASAPPTAPGPSTATVATSAVIRRPEPLPQPTTPGARHDRNTVANVGRKARADRGFPHGDPVCGRPCPGARHRYEGVTNDPHGSGSVTSWRGRR